MGSHDLRDEKKGGWQHMGETQILWWAVTRSGAEANIHITQKIFRAGKIPVS